MARPGSCVLLILLCVTSGVALEITAPPSVQTELGSSITLPFRFLVYDTINLNFLTIIWQKNGNMIVQFDTKDMVSEKRRFINKDDVSKGIADLHIQGVTTSDAGTYKCTVIHSPNVKSKEVTLTVYAMPRITHLEKVFTENEQEMFLCSVDGFYPRNITVDLLKDGKVIEGSSETSHVNDDGTFSVNKTVIISPEEKPRMLLCKVQHEALKDALQQNLLLAYKGKNESNLGMVVGVIIGVLVLILLVIAVVLYKKKSGLQDVVVSNIQGTPWVDGEKTTLHCTASYCPKDAIGSWTIKNKDGTTFEVTDAEAGDKEEEQPLMSREYTVTTEKIPSQRRKGLYDITTKLTFIPSIHRHLGSDITCTFTSDKNLDKKTFAFKAIQVKPKFIDPIRVSHFNHQDVELSAIIQRFYPKPVVVTWSSKKGQSQESKISSEDEIMVSADATFNLKSKCIVPGEDFKDPTFKVIVTWKHESMDVAQSRELSVKDLPWRPTIEEDMIKSSFQGDEVHLQCVVSNYFPDALSVKWFQKQKGSEDLIEVLHSEKYIIPEIKSDQKENKTFTSRALLYFKKSLIKKDIKFICRVDHPSLKAPIQCSTWELQDTDNKDFIIINNIQGPQKWFIGEKVTLYCSALYCMENSQVTWIVTGKEGNVQELSESPSREEIRSHGLQPPEYQVLRERTDVSDKEGLQDITTSLTFTPSVSKHKKVTIGCMICSGERTKKKVFHRTHLFAKPKVFTPIKLSLTDSGEVLCSLDIEEFYPKNIQIKWNETETANEVLKNNDGTFKTQSRYKLFGNFFKDPKSTLIVSWKHESMGEWDSRQISILDKEFPWKPEIKDILVPNLIIGSEATLKCEISNVFPDALHVRWLKKERDSQELFQLVPSSKYSVSEIKPEKQKDNTFTYKACLKFIPTISTEEGAKFVCRVEHPGLEEATEKSTKPLSIKGLPVVKDIVCMGQGIYSLDVDRVYPQEISFSWKLLVLSTEESEPLKSSATHKDNEDGSYIITSICDLTKSTNDQNKWSVLQATVEHETLDSPIHRRIDLKNTGTLSPEKSPKESLLPKSEEVVHVKATIPQKDDRQTVIVGDINGPKRWVHGEKVTLYCSVTYCPENVSVIWTVKESDGNEVTISSEKEQESTSVYFLTRETDTSDKDGLCNVTSLLTLTPCVTKHIGAVLTCKIMSNGKSIKKEFQPKSIYGKLAAGNVKTTLCDPGDVLCSLDLYNVYPKQITLNWTTDGKKLKSTDEWLENTEKIYNMRSHCTIQQHLLMNPNFTVSVTWKHKSMDTEESRVLSRRDLVGAWCPNIQEVPVPRVLINKETTLRYNISQYFPDAVSVSWYKKEKGGQTLIPLPVTYKPSITQSQRQPDNTFSCTACLVFTPLIKDDGCEIICRVEHPSREKPMEGSSGPLSAMAPLNKKRPLKLTLGKEDVKYSLTMEKFYPKDVHIQWSYRSKDQITDTCTSNEKYTNNMDKTFNVTSECRLPEKLLHLPGFRVRVTWRHESMDEPEYTEISIQDNNYPWKPMMEISVPSLRLNEEASVQCTITNYFPNTLSAIWLRKDRTSGETRRVSPSDMYKVSNNDLERQTDSTYSCQSCLTFIPTLEEQGAEFICQVQHPSLELAMERSTGPLEISGVQENPPENHEHNESAEERGEDINKENIYLNNTSIHPETAAGIFQENPPPHYGHSCTGYENPSLPINVSEKNEAFRFQENPENHGHNESAPSLYNAEEMEEDIRAEENDEQEEMDVS